MNLSKSMIIGMIIGMIVGVTACSAEMSNNCAFKPIDVEVYAE